MCTLSKKYLNIYSVMRGRQDCSEVRTAMPASINNTFQANRNARVEYLHT